MVFRILVSYDLDWYNRYLHQCAVEAVDRCSLYAPEGAVMVYLGELEWPTKSRHHYGRWV